MYSLIDSGNQKKLEKFGPYTLVRPCSQALWKPRLKETEWRKADASFSREEGSRWEFNKPLPPSWVMEWKGIRFKIAPTDFGHLGLFPEHAQMGLWTAEQVRKAGRPIQLLNLFAYSGGVTLWAAQAGAHVCHLDASKGMVAWARENAALNQMDKLPIRWIVEDALKFLKRELNRGRRYDAILLDPPTFGRGSSGELFKIERDIGELLSLCRSLLSADPLFLAFSTHTPGMTPLVMHHLLEECMAKGVIESGEMTIEAERLLPSGSYARWTL